MWTARLDQPSGLVRDRHAHLRRTWPRRRRAALVAEPQARAQQGAPPAPATRTLEPVGAGHR